VVNNSKDRETDEDPKESGKHNSDRRKREGSKKGSGEIRREKMRCFVTKKTHNKKQTFLKRGQNPNQQKTDVISMEVFIFMAAFFINLKQFLASPSKSQTDITACTSLKY